MTIHVTAEDIHAGCTGHARFCPIARAIERATGIRPVVSYDDVMLDFKAYRLPIECKNFMYCFDHSVPVKPFSFELNYPCPKPTTTK